MGFVDTLVQIDRRKNRECELEAEIAKLRFFNNQLKEQVDELVDEVCDLEQGMEELQAEIVELKTKTIPDLSRDPDPYGLHGFSLSHRLHEIGFPE